MPYADHARNVECDRIYRRTEARRSSWRTWYHAQDKAALCQWMLWDMVRGTTTDQNVFTVAPAPHQVSTVQAGAR